MQENMDTDIKEQIDMNEAEEEWKKLLAENTRRFVERSKELDAKGISVHLDGSNYFKDIDDWFKEELRKLKVKYHIHE